MLTCRYSIWACSSLQQGQGRWRSKVTISHDRQGLFLHLKAPQAFKLHVISISIFRIRFPRYLWNRSYIYVESAMSWLFKLMHGEDWKRVSGLWKTYFSFSRTVEVCEENWKTTISHTVRNASSRVAHAVYVGLSLALTAVCATMRVLHAAVSSLTHSIHGVRGTLLSFFWYRQDGDAFAFFMNTCKCEHNTSFRATAALPPTSSCVNANRRRVRDKTLK